MSTEVSTESSLVERALALSGADGCVVLVSASSSASLRFAGNTLTTNGAGRDRSVTVVSVVGDAVGTRSASLSGATGDDAEGRAALAELVAASEAAAREAEPAEDASPLLGPDDATGLEEETAAFSSSAEDLSSGVFTGLARDLGSAFEAARGDGLLLYGFASADTTTTWLGSSTGLRLRHAQPTGYLEVTGKDTALAGTPGGSTWWGQSTRDWSDITVADVDAEVRRRLAWGRRSVELPAGRYETLLPPSAVADLLVYLYWSSAGRDAAEGRTVFSRAGGGTRVGEALAPAGTRLWSDPREPGLATEPFLTASASRSEISVFDNGLAIPSTDWVRDGSLGALLQTRASGRDSGSAVTPYVPNLLLSCGGELGGTGTTEDLVSRTRRALLLTCLWYIREVDPETLLLTGLTRDGVYLVEDGEVVGAVTNFRFNESPLDVLGRATEASAPVRCLPREWSDDFTWARMPALRVPDFNMSSVSQAS